MPSSTLAAIVNNPFVKHGVQVEGLVADECVCCGDEETRKEFLADGWCIIPRTKRVDLTCIVFCFLLFTFDSHQ